MIRRDFSARSAVGFLQELSKPIEALKMSGDGSERLMWFEILLEKDDQGFQFFQASFLFIN